LANNKHQQLAKLMRQILNDIDQHSNEVAKCLNFVQFYFYEKKFILGRPLMTREVIKQMTKSHYIGLQYFSPSLELKYICATTPWLSAIIGQDIILKSQLLPRQTNGWFIPWGVYTTLPKQNQQKLKENRQQTLLYCPLASEISKEIDWFEKEDASNSLVQQLLTIGAYYGENNLLKKIYFKTRRHCMNNQLKNG